MGEAGRWVDTGGQPVNKCGSVGVSAESNIVAVIQPESGGDEVSEGGVERLFDDHRLHLNRFGRGRCFAAARPKHASGTAELSHSEDFISIAADNRLLQYQRMLYSRSV